MGMERTNMPIAKLDRSVLFISGEAVKDWLSGLVTSSLNGPVDFGALLTPQGKIIADFFITAHEDGFLLDTPHKFKDDLFKRLRMYKLRAPIMISDVSDDFHVYALWSGEGDEGHADPRHTGLGRRLVTQDVIEAGADYDAHRPDLGIPDSQWDFEPASVFPADVNMDLLGGVDFKKGCFVGQEVVSRMKRKTTVKKRARGLKLGCMAKAGDPILAGERVIGELWHVRGERAIGLVRLDRLAASDDNPVVNGHAVTIMEGPDGHTP